MRPAFSSRTKRRGSLAPALRLFFVTASDMRHLYCDLTRNWSALDRNCAANACHAIGWDDRRWNGCASSSLSYCTTHPCCAVTHFVREGYFAPVRRCSLQVIALVSAELTARTCKSERVQTSGEMRALAKSRCRQVRHGAWRSDEA